ncbi:MAG: glycosyltransferase family 39 protein [Cryomorphaceae bacterium]
MIMTVLTVVLLSALAFSENLMPFTWLITGTVLAIAYISGTYVLGSRWTHSDTGVVLQNLTVYSILINSITAIGLYWLFHSFTGTFHEPRAADSFQYHDNAVQIAAQFRNLSFNFDDILRGYGIDDSGYNLFLGFVYSIFGTDPIAGRIANVVLATLSMRLLFKSALLLYNRQVAQTAALLFMLSPLTLYFVGVTLKEITMVYLVMLSFYHLYSAYVQPKLQMKTLVVAMLAVLGLFFFRVVLGVSMVISFGLFLSVNFFNRSTVRKRRVLIVAFISLLILIIVLASSELGTRLQELYAISGEQMTRELKDKSIKGGFSLQRGIIAPLLFIGILIAPFASLVYTDSQVTQAWLMSPLLIKNILAIFTLLGLYYSIKKRWKQDSFAALALIVYLLVLAYSAQTTSPRYQFAVYPFLMLFTAHGLVRYRGIRIFHLGLYCLIIVGVIMAWNYFKLSIRGLV